MAETVALSEAAVLALRLEIKGWRAKDGGRRQPAYRELAAAGIMEPVPGSEVDYRFTRLGLERREEILRDEWERIERARFAPPDVDAQIPDAARALLRRIVAGEPVEVNEANRPEFRALAEARIVVLGHSFSKGRESIFVFTYWGFRRRFVLAGVDPA